MLARKDYKTGDIPNQPGVYLFYDKFKTVIYVGKAKSLRKRMSSYFQPSRSRTADPKLRSLIKSIAFIDYQIVKNEQESLLLESQLIKKYSPRFNVVLRDDKRFLMVKIDMNEPYPKLQLVRLRKDDGARYFGPFPVAGALRETVNYLTQYFGLRVCSPRVPTEEDYKHCNADVIRRCTAPCINKISQEEYRQRVEDMMDSISGRIGEIKEDIEAKMRSFAEGRNFERAAQLRDVLFNLQEVFGKPMRNFRYTSRGANYPGPEGVDDLHQALELRKRPNWIECFDISNIMGQFTVASMVCFRDGKPAKKDYRHFHIKTVEGIDDFASMREVVLRRYYRQIEEGCELPDLIVIDGGLGQLHTAYEVLLFLKIAKKTQLVSLAKREEEVFTMKSNEPYVLDRHSPALRLLQCIRDEAHRFAITFNRDLRRKRILDSLLDEIPGVGKKRRNLLLKKFGSVRNLRKHDAEEIMRRCPGIGEALAKEIVAYLAKE